MTTPACEFLTYRDGSVDCLTHRWSGPAMPDNRTCPSTEPRVSPLSDARAASASVEIGDTAREALEQIAALQEEAVAYMRQHGFVIDVVGPLAPDATELDRWKVLVFSLYSDLCEARAIAKLLIGGDE